MPVMMPALPKVMSQRMMRRRTGWLIAASASAVVNPTPISAERAWNAADSLDMPVPTSAIVATRAAVTNSRATIRSDRTASTGPYSRTAASRSDG